LAGERTAGKGASFLYKIADVRIKVESGMSLNFWQKAENSLGVNVNIDLMFENASCLSGAAGYSLHNVGVVQNGWQKKTAAIPASLNGQYIIAVIVSYGDNGSTAGNFAALIDDIIIEQ